MKKTKPIRLVVESAMIAALYAAATLSLAPFSYGPFQFRISEAMTILPLFTPRAIVGLTVGCIIANIGSPFGIYDIVFGSLATFLAATGTYALRNYKIKGIPFLSLLSPAVFNSLIVGLMITLLDLNIKASIIAFLTVAGQIALSELVICYGLGLPFYLAIKRAGFDRLFNVK